MFTGAAPRNRAELAESAPYTRIFLPFQSASVRIGAWAKTCCDGQASIAIRRSPFLASISVQKGRSSPAALRRSPRLLVLNGRPSRPVPDHRLGLRADGQDERRRAAGREGQRRESRRDPGPACHGCVPPQFDSTSMAADTVRTRRVSSRTWIALWALSPAAAREILWWMTTILLSVSTESQPTTSALEEPGRFSVATLLSSRSLRSQRFCRSCCRGTSRRLSPQRSSCSSTVCSAWRLARRESHGSSARPDWPFELAGQSTSN